MGGIAQAALGEQTQVRAVRSEFLDVIKERRVKITVEIEGEASRERYAPVKDRPTSRRVEYLDRGIAFVSGIKTAADIKNQAERSAHAGCGEDGTVPAGVKLA